MTIPAGGFDLPDDADVQELIAQIAPGAQVFELGGSMNLNLRLVAADTVSTLPEIMVLRIYQRYITQGRLSAIQRVRDRLARDGLMVAQPLTNRGSSILRCSFSCAELEPYLPHDKLVATWDAYHWLFRVMGRLHHALANIELEVPRPLLSFSYSTSTMRRHLATTQAAVRDDAEAVEITHTVDALSRRVRRSLPSPARLPRQLVHGDINLDNIGPAWGGEPVYLDFGFVAHRPRIHDVAFTLAWTVLQDPEGTPLAPQAVPWDQVSALLEAYEDAAGVELTASERQALTPYTAMLRLPCDAHFAPDPAQALRDRLPAVELGSWLLDHPEALTS